MRATGRVALRFFALIVLVAFVVIPLALAVRYIGDTFGEGWSWAAVAVVLLTVAALRVCVLDRRKL